MIFMKGSPESPKCGFSRQLMEILQPLNIQFKTFDILEDEEVRQGLKKFSNWPTYPQVCSKLFEFTSSYFLSAIFNEIFIYF